MSPLFSAILLLLGLCLANAINFTTVYEWDKYDFVWPSGVNTSNEQIKWNVYFEYMAVFEERLFLSLEPFRGIPATLVWFPISGTSTAPPKLAPFPSWELHKKDNCDSIQAAKGMEIDTDGRLWVLDQGSSKCSSKLWIFDLLNNDTTELVHQFPDSVVSHRYFKRELRDIVLDKTPQDYLAYITDSFSDKIVVYSRKMDKSWTVTTPGRKWNSLALSPDREATQLYLARYFSNELYSVSVSQLKNEGGRAAVKLVGEWFNIPCRMLIDSANVLYAAFKYQSYLSKWKNISEPFRDQRFYEVERLDAEQPFTFALDTNGTLWLTERNAAGSEKRHKIIKAAVGARSYLFKPSTAMTAPQAYVSGGETSDDMKITQTPTVIVISLLVCCLFLCGSCQCVVNLVRLRRKQTSLRHISKDNREQRSALVPVNL